MANGDDANGGGQPNDPRQPERPVRRDRDPSQVPLSEPSEPDRWPEDDIARKKRDD